MTLPREELRAIFSSCADGVPATWDDRGAGFQAGVRILLRVMGSSEVGWDDTLDEWIEEAGARKVTSIERRLVRLTARVDSYDPTQYTVDIAEKIRTRLYRDTSRAALKAIKMSYLGSMSLNTISWQADTRACVSSVLDLKFYHLNLDAQTDNQGGVIETADVSGTTTP